MAIDGWAYQETQGASHKENSRENRFFHPVPSCHEDPIIGTTSEGGHNPVMVGPACGKKIDRAERHVPGQDQIVTLVGLRPGAPEQTGRREGQR